MHNLKFFALLLLLQCMFAACDKGEVQDITPVSTQASDMSASRSSSTLTYIQLSQQEVKRIQAGESFNIIAPNGQPYPSTGELVVICYDGIGSSPPDCFGIWGTDSCADPLIKCTDGCTCSELPD